MKKLVTVFILSLVAFLGVVGFRVVKLIEFKQNCSGYLERAANATTTETARKELKTATKYLEQNSLTIGYTSVLWKTPSEDVGFWYDNIKAAEKELEKVTENTTALEKTNILMKLRETLMEKGKDSDNITVPSGLSIYPNNLLMGILFWITFLPLAISAGTMKK